MRWLRTHRPAVYFAAVGFAIPTVEAVGVAIGWTYSPAWLGWLLLALCPAVIPALPAFVEQDPTPGTALFWAIWAFVAGLNAVIYAVICLLAIELRNARRAKKIRGTS
jgi:RsiW-degrading membrane proteinase PrsW (M82 family)